jgi:excinuclease UvrABC nuclease subunit
MIEPTFIILLEKAEIVEFVDNVPGCYAAFSPDKRECLYVGRSCRLRTRVMAHFIDQRDGHGVQWRLGGAVEYYRRSPFCSAESILKIWACNDFVERELFLILKLKPKFNKTTKGSYVMGKALCVNV